MTLHVDTKCPRCKVKYQYCHTTEEHQVIEGKHKEVCSRFPLSCPNHCNVGTIPREDMEEHRRVCPMEVIYCLNNCGKTLERWCLNNHITTKCPRCKIICQYCHNLGEYQFIEGQHKLTCSKLPIPCPNKCDIGNIPRDEVNEHISICPLQIIKCKYHIVGCEAVMPRKDQKQHNKDVMEEHLSLSVVELATSQRDAKKTTHNLTQQLATANKEMAVLKQQLVMLTNKSLAKAKELESMQQSLDMVVWNWSTYLENEATKFLSGIELLPVLMKMSNFTEKIRRNETWFSIPFYTHSNGYKMQLVVFPNDVNDSGSRMGVCLQLLKGPFDDELLWPMSGEFEVKLLNQSNNGMHYSVICSITSLNSSEITTKRNKSNSCYKVAYICHKVFAATNVYVFLKHDNIYFQVCKPLR